MQIKEQANKYIEHISLSEKKQRTVEQYQKYIEEFLTCCPNEEVSKQEVLNYKEYLQREYKPNTVNIKITVINSFLEYAGHSDYKLKHLKQQQRTTLENVLSQTDYERLLRIAEKRGKIQTLFIMRTLAETGIRISELKYFTVEAVKKGYTTFDSKGTVERQAFVNKKLQKDLLQYCKDAHIKEGIIFRSKKGNALDNAYIYKEIQYIARTSESKKEQGTPSQL